MEELINECRYQPITEFIPEKPVYFEDRYPMVEYSLPEVKLSKKKKKAKAAYQAELKHTDYLNKDEIRGLRISNSKSRRMRKVENYAIQHKISITKAMIHFM